jgi:hypothetical protein
MKQSVSVASVKRMVAAESNMVRTDGAGAATAAEVATALQAHSVAEVAVVVMNQGGPVAVGPAPGAAT